MKKLLSLVGIVILVMATFSLPVYAAVRSDDVVRVNEGETVDDDFFAAGNEIIIEGTVNGDVYAAGDRIIVRGTVNGDVLAAGSFIEITGSVRDDVRAAGDRISLVGASVGDSISVGGNELRIDDESTVAGGVVFGGRLLALEGTVGRGVTSGSETTRIGNDVGRTVRVAATNVVIEEGAVIEGDLEYSSENDAVIAGVVTGTVERGEGGGLNLDTEGIYRLFVVGFTTWAFIGATLIAALMVFFMPKLFVRGRESIQKDFWRTAGVGTIATLATLPAVIILMVTVIGIPLGIVLLTLWFLSIYFAKFFVAYAAGAWTIEQFSNRKVNDKRSSMFLATVLGLLGYYLLRLSPWIGPFVRFGTVVVGLGVIVLLLINTRRVAPTSKKNTA